MTNLRAGEQGVGGGDYGNGWVCDDVIDRPGRAWRRREAAMASVRRRKGRSGGMEEKVKRVAGRRRMGRRAERAGEIVRCRPR